uniref:Uncharacterized protein n=1 Tax=Anguilla anguilla TaxID=7936 RepID=A0A0E9XTD6_ANGAN
MDRSAGPQHFCHHHCAGIDIWEYLFGEFCL